MCYQGATDKQCILMVFYLSFIKDILDKVSENF